MTEEDRSITAVRDRIASIVRREAGDSGRSVVVVALDGIPYHLARVAWTHANIERMRSVFPTTSSSAWLSSLTGLAVDEHGVPGVVYRPPDGATNQLINVYDYQGNVTGSPIENIFSDSKGYGYRAVAILGDLEDYDCSWRTALLRHSDQVVGHRFYTRQSGRYLTVDDRIGDRVGQALDEVLAANSSDAPTLVWCFVEPDKHIHHFGYDEHIAGLLGAIERIALRLVDRGVVVVAHSDHGLTPTDHDPQVDALLQQLEASGDCQTGGAGRTRWLYAAEPGHAALRDRLPDLLPDSVRVADATDFFAAGSAARSAVGSILLIAESTEFVTHPGHHFDHGSLTEQELRVPFAVWTA